MFIEHILELHLLYQINILYLISIILARNLLTYTYLSIYKFYINKLYFKCILR